MKHLRRLMIMATVALFTNVQAQDAQDIGSATTAAQQWLGLTDTQQYAATYSTAAPAFQQAIKQKDWEQAVQAARKPLGEVKQRTMKSATFAKDLPGAPRGDYVVIVYGTAFANQAVAVETVTPMRDADGKWKVSGYFVR